MEIIRRGITEKHTAGEASQEFADAIYTLFREFSTEYKTEWDRIDDNERIYQGNHWEGIDASLDDNNKNAPKPTTPIITSTIENLKADLSDEFPEPIVLPDSTDDEVAAKVLTQALAQELEACGFQREFDKHTQDVLNCGWSPWEVGYDAELNQGLGGSYIRYVINKNFMCDPQVINLQEGRACFKFDRRPYDWFVQHYPEHVPHMKQDNDLAAVDHDDFGATTAAKTKNGFRLIEAWFRIYDPDEKKTKVHMVLLAGGQVLANSHDEFPDGYFKHGKYPFVITRLFPQKGSSLGLGITDLFKDAQRYSDKLDQILLLNTFRASRPRLMIQKGMVDYDDARDFSKEVIETEGSPQAATAWQQANPLPAHIMAYIATIRESIKTESGSNEQSRGNTTSGVTAASAIAALQEMSTKRSRMEARALHYGFEEACMMQLDVMEECSIVERKIHITVEGQKTVMPFSNKTFRRLFEGGTIPIGYRISIKTSRQTRYTKLQHNELWLQMMQVLRDTVDPAIMIEGLEYEEKERLLDNIRKAQQGGMMNLQRQLSELSQVVQQQNADIAQYQKALAQAQNYIAQTQNMQATQGIRNEAYERIAGAAEQSAEARPTQFDPMALSRAM